MNTTEIRHQPISPFISCPCIPRRSNSRLVTIISAAITAPPTLVPNTSQNQLQQLHRHHHRPFQQPPTPTSRTSPLPNRAHDPDHRKTHHSSIRNSKLPRSLLQRTTTRAPPQGPHQERRRVQRRPHRGDNGRQENAGPDPALPSEYWDYGSGGRCYAC